MMFGSLKSRISSSELQSGGYDYEFIDSVPERLTCPICAKVTKDPHLVVCCGQKYCHSCLQKWLNTKHPASCPHCQASEKEFQHVVEKGVKGEIESFHIKCSNHEKGCEWTGELGNLLEHLKESRLNAYYHKRDEGCDYAIIRCCCFWTGERRQYNDHLAKECPESRVQCPYKCQGGNTKVLRKNLSYHLEERCEARHNICPRCCSWGSGSSHDDVCPKFPMSCPNICGQEGLVRDSIHSHLLVCKYEVVPCKYCHLGCEEKVRRHDMPQHLVSHQGQHLEMVEKDYEKIKAELKETKMEFANKAEIVRQEIKFAEEKYTLGWPLQFEDSVASLKTQFEECQVYSGKELTFRMLNFREVMKSNISWRSLKFRLLEHDIQLRASGCGQPNTLGLELWNTIPQSSPGSSVRLRIIVKAKKPAFRKLKSLSFSLSNASPSPQKIHSIPLSSKLSSPHVTPYPLARDKRAGKPDHGVDSKHERGLFVTEKTAISPSKPKVINWDNPILAKPSSSTCEITSNAVSPVKFTNNAALPVELTTSSVLTTSTNSSSFTMKTAQAEPWLKLQSASSLSSTSHEPSPISTVLNALPPSQPSRVVPSTTQTSSLSGAGSILGLKKSQPFYPSSTSVQSSSFVFSRSTAVTMSSREPIRLRLSGSNTQSLQSSSGSQLGCLSGTKMAQEPQSIGSESRIASTETEKKTSSALDIPEIRNIHYFTEAKEQTEEKQSPDLAPLYGPFYFDFQPISLSNVPTGANPGSEHLLCSWVATITPECEETYVENNSVLWTICTIKTDV